MLKWSLSYILYEKLKRLISLSNQINSEVICIFIIALLRLDNTREERIQDTRRYLIGLVEQWVQYVKKETFYPHIGLITVNKNVIKPC